MPWSVKRAFTLLELIVVLVILGLILGLIFPRLSRFLPQKPNFPQKVWIFVQNLRLQALIKHQNILLIFSPEERSLYAFSSEEEKRWSGLSIPENFEIKARGLLELEGDRKALLFLANGASSGGEIELVNHQTGKRILWLIPKCQLFMEVRSE